MEEKNLSKKNYSRKYIVPGLVATSIVLSPILADNAFAYGGPETGSTENSSMINETKQSEQQTTEVTTTSTSVLSKGDRGDAVVDVQRALNNHGANLKEDAIFGLGTEDSVKDFQKDNSLPVDGKVGQKTKQALDMNQTSAEAKDSTDEKVEEESTDNSTILSQGDQGENVKELQASLNDHGDNLNKDGTFGSSTDQALRSFQQSNGLAVDGKAGPATLQALSESPKAETASDESDDVTITEAPEQETKSVTVSSNDSSSDVVSTANSLVGSAYVPGGTTPAGFDSSGFINYVFKQAGVSLERTHQGMWDSNGVHVDTPQVGDVVFFTNTYDPGDGRHVTHSGIYIGNNQMIHAGTASTGVNVADISIDYWDSKYIGAKSFQ